MLKVQAYHSIILRKPNESCFLFLTWPDCSLQSVISARHKCSGGKGSLPGAHHHWIQQWIVPVWKEVKHTQLFGTNKNVLLKEIGRRNSGCKQVGSFSPACSTLQTLQIGRALAGLTDCWGWDLSSMFNQMKCCERMRSSSTRTSDIAPGTCCPHLQTFSGTLQLEGLLPHKLT